MNPLIIFIFIIILSLYVYGYYTYYYKGKQSHMPHCDIIYILNEGMDESGHPDFNDGRQNDFYNLEIKKEHRNASGLDIFWEEKKDN